MKMNITFCVSSIPNHRMVSGMSAATGRLRPNSASGAPADSRTRHEPAAMPSGTPTSAARATPAPPPPVFGAAPGAGGDAERHPDERGEPEAAQHALECGRNALQQPPLVQQPREAAQPFGGAGQDARRAPAILRADPGG